MYDFPPVGNLLSPPKGPILDRFSSFICIFFKEGSITYSLCTVHHIMIGYGKHVLYKKKNN